MKNQNLETKIDQTLDSLASFRKFDYLQKTDKPAKGKQPAVTYKTYFKYITDKTEKLLDKKEDKTPLPIVYNKSILLSFAFNMALKNYQTVEEKGKPILLFEMVNSTMKEQLKIDLKKGENKLLKEFEQFEPKLRKALDQFRNFHSHYFHNTGIVCLKDDFNDNNKDFDAVKDWLQFRFEDTKKHLLHSLATNLARVKTEMSGRELQQATIQIEETKTKIESFNFYYKESGQLSHEAQLFFAATFMQKSQINYVLKKWAGIKKSEGFYKIIHTFFTKSAIPDKYAIASELQDIAHFRNLVSNLSLMPYSEHPNLQVFYDTIKEENNNVCEKLDKERDKIKKDTLKLQIINLRKKKTILIHWLLNYMIDRNLLDGFKLAYHKKPEDYENADLSGLSLADFKLALKQEKDKSIKKQMNEQLKLFKRNFRFDVPTIDNKNYCIKKNNAILQYEIKLDNIPVLVQVTVSAHYLLKWAFLDITTNNEENIVAKDLKSFITSYCNKMYRKDIAQIQEEINKGTLVKDIPLRKIVPSSIQKNYNATEADSKNQAFIDTALSKKINDKQEEINHFMQLNSATKAPWRFAAKRKIDYILEYNHFEFIKKIYEQSNLTEEEKIDKIRHAAPREGDYLEAYNFIRFYGRYKDTIDFKEHFSNEYYNAIRSSFGNCNSLEELFNHTITTYRKKLSKIIITENNKLTYAKVFKLKRVAETEKIAPQLQQHFLKAISISGDILDINKHLKDKSQYTLSSKSTKTDFSDIRKILEQQKTLPSFSTNIDFMMQRIFPLVLKKKDEGESITINSTVYNNLLKLKTEELMLWNIAKYYWHKAYNTDFSLHTLADNTHGFQQNTFNTIYKQDLKIKYGNTTVTVSPKKFDDEYQYLNNEIIQHYLDWYLKKDQRSIDFVTLNKKIKDQLYSNLDDVYLALENEKILWQKHTAELKAMLIAKYADNATLTDFYIEFDKLSHYLAVNGIEAAAISSYRNNAMHYQLQNPATLKAIQQQLIKNIKDYTAATNT